MIWRRSYATPPPEINPDDPYAQDKDPRYAGDPVPEAEALANVVARVTPYWESAIEPELKSGKTVLIAAHGNSLRAIVKMLDGLSEEEISKVNIPTASRCSTSWTRTSSRSSPVASTSTPRPPQPVPPQSPRRARARSELAERHLTLLQRFNAENRCRPSQVDWTAAVFAFRSAYWNESAPSAQRRFRSNSPW